MVMLFFLFKINSVISYRKFFNFGQKKKDNCLFGENVIVWLPGGT